MDLAKLGVSMIQVSLISVIFDVKLIKVIELSDDKVLMIVVVIQSLLKCEQRNGGFSLGNFFYIQKFSLSYKGIPITLSVN